MTSICVINSRKAISSCQENSTQFTAQQSRFPTYRPDGPEEASRRPPVFKEMSEHLNRHQPQRARIRIDVRIAQQKPKLETTC
jgi:hypothetical protein